MRIEFPKVETQLYVLNKEITMFRHINNVCSEGVELYLKYKNIDLSEIPILENMHSKVFEAIQNDVYGFNMSSFHSPCGTIHCWAGWIEHLANGYWLNNKIDTIVCTKLINYVSSAYQIPKWMFYTENKEAWLHIKAFKDLELGIKKD